MVMFTLNIREPRTCTEGEMEKMKSTGTAPFKGKDITALAGKLKQMALNTPLQFSIQALRPHSKSAARFGSLSHHSFFSRHNPHPQRVTHIQGLNGAPVCTVNDEWSEQNVLPSHSMIKSPFRSSVLRVPGVQVPIGDPPPFPVPRLSVGSLSDAWREELKELAARVRAASSIEVEKKETTETSGRETKYSEETGRLVPPPSRATTRHSSRRLHKNNAKNNGKGVTTFFQDQELIILELLCQILQTDSLTAIQQWLLTSSQRDKDLVMGLLQIATAHLHLETRDLTTSVEERLPSQLSQHTAGFASRLYTLYSLRRNHSIRVSVINQKQEAIQEEEKPVHIGTAEVLQLHSNEKQNQSDRTN
uniref:Protein TBATA n=1 Tax=Pogona vitticeps TaxID=103695 RepID=A0ABM5G118_9SAUR